MSGWTKSFDDLVPSDSMVVGVRAKVYGASVSALDASTNITVELNGGSSSDGGVSLGSFAAVNRSCGRLGGVCGACFDGGGACDPVVSAPLDGGSGYRYGAGDAGINRLTLKPSTNYYCVSHVELSLSLAKRRGSIRVAPELDFGKQKQNLTSAPTRTLTVHNDSDGPLNVSGLSLSSSTPFTIVTPSRDAGQGFVIDPHSSYDIELTFKPSALGAVSRFLTIDSDATNAGSGGDTIVELKGFGVQYINDVDTDGTDSVPEPLRLKFGEQRARIASQPKTVRVQNAGNASLIVSIPPLVGPFALSPLPGPNPFTLNAGEGADLKVVFNPTAAGPATGSLTLRTSATDGRPDVTVDLEGTGVDPRLVVSKPLLAFGKRIVGDTPVSDTVQLSVSGDGTLPVVVPQAIPGTSFTIAPYGLFNMTMDGGTRDLTVTFNPDNVGLQEVPLEFRDDGGVSLGRVEKVSGEGVAAFRMEPSNGLIDFGPVRIDGDGGTATVSFINRGTAPIRFSGLSKPSAPFSTPAGTPTQFVLGSRETKRIDVAFNPTSVDSFTGALTWNSNADPEFSPNSSVGLKGRGAVVRGEFRLALDDAGTPLTNINFEGVRVNTTSQVMVRLANTGGLPLTFQSPKVVHVSPIPDGGTSSGWFFYQGAASWTIERDQHYDFVLSFTPEVKEMIYNGTFSIQTNALNSADGGMTLPLQGFGAYSQLSVDPKSLTFGDIPVGTSSSAKSVTVFNSGNATVMLSEPSVRGPFSLRYPNGRRPPVAISRHTPYTFDVVFNPSQEGAADGGIIITDPGGEVPELNVGLSGYGTVAKLGISPADFKFNNQRVGETSGVQALTIKNQGQAPLFVYQLFSSDDSVFKVVEPSVFNVDAGLDGGLTLNPGQAEVVKVTFTPKELGPATGTLFINSSSATTWVNPPMTGTGVAGQIKVEPSFLAFVDPPVDVDGTATAQAQVRISNTGKASLTIRRVRQPEDSSFSVSGLPADGGTLTLGPAPDTGSPQEWPLTVTFKPRQRGTFFTSTVIESDSFSSPMLPLPLSGTGVAAAVVLVPDQVPFGQSNVGTATVQNIGINNVGEKTLYVANIAFTDVEGSDAGMALDFKTEMTFQQAVDAGSTLTVPIEFKPRQVGAREARAIIYSNARTADGGHAEAHLWGEGTVPGLKLDPTNLSFGDVLVGSPSEATLKITNTGSGPLTVNSITLGGPDMASFALAKPDSAVTLARGASLLVSVTFKPSEERTFLANLMVSTNNVDAPNVPIGLRGTGVRHQIHAEPSPLSFGNQLVNSNSNWRTLTITNNRKEVVSIRSITTEGPFERDPALTLPRDLQGKSEGQDGGTATGINKLDVGVRIKPQVEGEVKGKLRITFTDQALHPIEVELQGSGIPAVLSITPSSLDFGAVRAGGEARPLTFTINNLSDDEIELGNPVVLRSTGESFDYVWSSLENRKLSARERYSVTVGYKPQSETTSDITLNFGTKKPAWLGEANLQLKGRAVKRILGVEPESLDFGKVEVGKPMPSKEVTITNLSAHPQKVLVALKGEGPPFVLEAKALEVPLPPSGVATFTVGFAPTEAGLVENEVRISLQGDTVADAIIPVAGYGRKQQWSGGGGCALGGNQTGVAALVALVTLVRLGSRRRRRE
ncbi:choice-of-anchor D domain-containing protein [Archangium lipolyticum]|uniref:choice-of-anchor D domain-containing protein n=1 Tax=Archangium lipolyticum TaxID=2970465 RepID=UPI00214A7D8D|nr:choice-of-anchor D domain-containing protein [Archangium lipolyticum]